MAALVNQMVSCDQPGEDAACGEPTDAACALAGPCWALRDLTQAVLRDTALEVVVL